MGYAPSSARTASVGGGGMEEVVGISHILIGLIRWEVGGWGGICGGGAVFSNLSGVDIG